jgi:hypothetical protein
LVVLGGKAFSDSMQRRIVSGFTEIANAWKTVINPGTQQVTVSSAAAFHGPLYQTRLRETLKETISPFR